MAVGKISRRRMLLAGGALLALGAAAGFRSISNGGDLAFEDLPRARGFRRIRGGAVSAPRDFMIGIEETAGGAETTAIGNSPEAICAALHKGDSPPADLVPIAYFTDYNCPYCRVLSGILETLSEDPQAGVRIYWHEYPVLGEASLMAARGALAARRQGAYKAFHRRLMRSRFLPDENYLRALAGGMGLDASRLLRDMGASRIDDDLARTRALARRFALRGTPALVVGRTLVEGDISADRLGRLVALEREDGGWRRLCNAGAPEG